MAHIAPVEHSRTWRMDDNLRHSVRFESGITHGIISMLLLIQRRVSWTNAQIAKQSPNTLGIT